MQPTQIDQWEKAFGRSRHHFSKKREMDMKNNSIACSVVIPSFRSSSTIKACLTALLSQDFALSYDITVVDSSPDDTAKYIRDNFPQVRVIHLPQQTEPGAARNIGATEAQGEVLAFIDADCIANPDWLQRLYGRIKEGYDAVGGAIANGNKGSLVSWAGYFCEFREFLPGGQAHLAQNLTLGNAAYQRSVFWSLGGFPTGYFPQEDQVFHQLMRGQGFRIWLDPQIIVAHTHRSELKAFLDHQRHIGRVNAQVINKLNLEGAGLVRHPRLLGLALPLLIGLRFVRTLRACWRLENSIVWRRPVLAGLCGLGIVWWARGFLSGANALANDTTQSLLTKESN